MRSSKLLFFLPKMTIHETFCNGAVTKTKATCRLEIWTVRGSIHGIGGIHPGPLLLTFFNHILTFFSSICKKLYGNYNSHYYVPWWRRFHDVRNIHAWLQRSFVPTMLHELLNNVTFFVTTLHDHSKSCSSTRGSIVMEQSILLQFKLEWILSTSFCSYLNPFWSIPENYIKVIIQVIVYDDQCFTIYVCMGLYICHNMVLWIIEQYN